MQTAVHFVEHLPELLNRWAEDIDRLKVEPEPPVRQQPPVSRRRVAMPVILPPLERWAEAVERLRAV